MPEGKGGVDTKEKASDLHAGFTSSDMTV